MFYKYRHWNQFTKSIFTSNSLYYSEATSFNDLFECVVSPETNTVFLSGGHKTLIAAARSNYRILCLSKAKNHPLMWAHYADSYKGICLEFDFLEGDQHYNKPIKIGYDDIPPIVTDQKLNTGANILQEMFFFKHTSWEYENEYRVVVPKTTVTVPFNPASLKAVYIAPAFVSASIFHEVQLYVRDYNQRNGTAVRLIRLRRKEHSYEIEEDVIT